MHDPTNLASFDLRSFDPVARPRRQAAAQPAPAAPRRKKAATAEPEPPAALAPALPAIDPAELSALQGELSALRAEVAALKDAPEAEARRRALAEAWAADLAWRGREGGRGL